MTINKENTAKAIGKVKAIASEKKPIGEYTLNELHDYCEHIQTTYNHDCEHCKVYKECLASNFDDPYLWKIGGMNET